MKSSNLWSLIIISLITSSMENPTPHVLVRSKRMSPLVAPQEKKNKKINNLGNFTIKPTKRLIDEKHLDILRYKFIINEITKDELQELTENTFSWGPILALKKANNHPLTYVEENIIEAWQQRIGLKHKQLFEQWAASSPNLVNDSSTQELSEE